MGSYAEKRIAAHHSPVKNSSGKQEQPLQFCARVNVIVACGPRLRLPAVRDPFMNKADAVSRFKKLGLTHREADVLLWIGRGKSNAEIGVILCISPRTVKKHLEHVFRKLGVKTRLAAAVRAGQVCAKPSSGGTARPSASDKNHQPAPLAPSCPPLPPQPVVPS